MKLFKPICLLGFFIGAALYSPAQARWELHSNWQCAPLTAIAEAGTQISVPGYPLKNWLPATVPGTVLTTMLNNKIIADPFYGINNKYIPDIYFTGNKHYTYWFVNDFILQPRAMEQVWLHLRGVNYAYDIFLNGKQLNQQLVEGMMMRSTFNITKHLLPTGNNRLAILVYPPTNPGNPNGGQGGDGTIAQYLTSQYTAGWDWIEPMRDRNTGIWDKVIVEKTGPVKIADPHVITEVPGVRRPGDAVQNPAIIKLRTALINTATHTVKGMVQYSLNGHRVSKPVSLPPGDTVEIHLPALTLHNPRLWWPNGYGEQYLYPLYLSFQSNGQLWSTDTLQVGVRQIDNVWNAHTQSMQAMVNGQKIFIKGGNWIVSDAMLRFSKERYDAEVRFHRDMNLNLIRIWGGAITERPEFYAACDKYGLLVFQDFWFSGDCNGRWLDPMKKEDQWTRRKYPLNHSLAIAMAADQVKMIRNHASLAFWCGGNEITPPQDILTAIKDSILPGLDGTRYFFDYSNSDSMSLNTLGGNGDGPYGIQHINYFWSHKTYPYNSEVGSVGVGDYASLQRFIPAANLLPPASNARPDSIWEYHKYLPYGRYMDAYGKPQNAKDFAMKAQLINYNQYRALMEGFSAHMWQWYTGSIIWKTQNPWTALRGQMYDCYLDVNACLYGLRSGSEPLHIMMNPTDSMLMMVNNGFDTRRDLIAKVTAYDVKTGKATPLGMMFNEIGPSMAKKLFSLAAPLQKLNQQEGVFLSLQLMDKTQQVLSENFYWLPDANENYTALQQMPRVNVHAVAHQLNLGTVNLTLQNDAQNAVAFFVRAALVNKHTGLRVLPAFFSHNYISILPGETKTITVQTHTAIDAAQHALQIYGWNVPEQQITINH